LRQTLSRELESLAGLIVERYTSGDGGLFTKVDVTNGRIVDSSPAVDELGDYAQNVLYGGLVLGRQDLVEWTLNSVVRLAGKYQSRYGPFFKGLKRNPFRNHLLTIHNADTATGLVSLYVFTRDRRIRAILERFIEGLFRNFSNHDFLIYGYFFRNLVKVNLASLLFSAYLIEELLILCELQGEGNWLEPAGKVIKANLRDGYYREYGIFQARIPLGLEGPLYQAVYRYGKGDDLRTTFLVKENVYWLFALLRYYALTREPHIKDSIFQVHQRIGETFRENGTYYNAWHPVDGRLGGPSRLQHSHSVIELLLDLYHEFKDHAFLDEATSLAERWLSRQTPLGIVGESLEDDRPVALLDSNVDFAIDLVKLSEKTHRVAYRDRAAEIAEGIIGHFKADYGFYWEIDGLTGRPSNGLIETKYLGLLLKLFLVLIETEDGRTIFENAKLHNLARDR
jgi:hypothetical protein